MPKAIIVYSSRTGQTKVIGEFIAEGLRISGIEVDMFEAGKVTKEADLAGYDAYIFGSPTYHGEMMSSLKTFLFLAEKSGLENKIGASFGAFGWSGEAPGRIYDTMNNVLKMDMVSGPLMLKSANIGGGIKMAQEYGQEIAKKIQG